MLTESLNDCRKIVLGHDENTFTIQLATTLAGQQAQPHILYRLRGYESKWSAVPSNDPYVHFTSLAPGRYTLEVRMTNADGTLSPRIDQLKIVIRPPFYLQPWALVVYVLLLLLLVWDIRRRLRLRRISELQKMELRKQKEVEEAKIDFFTNISHELRTPLTLILSPLESMTRRQDYDATTLRQLRLIQRNARQLLMMVNKMLDLRRMMRGKEKVKLTTGDLISYIHELCEPFSALSDKGITLTFHAGVAHLILPFDKGKIDRMVTNLLSNAYKFTPVGGRVDVSVSLTDQQQVLISVADNGPGVSDKDKPHLFERFYQAEDGKTHQGSGIGLNLTWEYAQMLGGTIKLEDNKNRGALFTITLPAKDLKAEGEGYVQALDNDNTVPAAIPTKSTGAANENRRQQRSTLLLVDDNTDFLGFLSEELQANYRILKAENGKQALEVIHHDMPDLVITDVMMPVMDGNELCRKIKGSDKTHHLPVMVLTARLADENEIESRECGADDYIKKPFSMDLFRLHIDQLLKQGRIVDNGKVDPKISKTAITTQDEAFIDKATHYIEEHLCDSELTVEQMSDDLAMSRVQLYRRIVSITGKTPSELIRLVRLRHAERLVVQSQLSISEISYMVGFSSTRYFSRCFKELYGYLPSRYKKNAE